MHSFSPINYYSSSSRRLHHHAQSLLLCLPIPSPHHTSRLQALSVLSEGILGSALWAVPETKVLSSMSLIFHRCVHGIPITYNTLDVAFIIHRLRDSESISSYLLQNRMVLKKSRKPKALERTPQSYAKQLANIIGGKTDHSVFAVKS